MLASAEQGNGRVDAPLPGLGGLGGGDVADVIPLHAAGELGEERAGLLIGRERGGEAGRNNLPRCKLDAQQAADSSATRARPALASHVRNRSACLKCDLLIVRRTLTPLPGDSPVRDCGSVSVRPQRGRFPGYAW